jgi:hypothetical protein
LLAFPHGLPDHRFMLQFVLTAPPQDHEPSISSPISLPICRPLSISPTSYRNSPMGPPPFISVHDIYASPGAFINHWGTHFCILYIIPTFIYSFVVQTPFLTNLCFYRHRWRPAFLFGRMQPMSPLVGVFLLIFPC